MDTTSVVAVLRVGTHRGGFFVVDGLLALWHSPHVVTSRALLHTESSKNNIAPPCAESGNSSHIQRVVRSATLLLIRLVNRCQWT